MRGVPEEWFDDPDFMDLIEAILSRAGNASKTIMDLDKLAIELGWSPKRMNVQRDRLHILGLIWPTPEVPTTLQ